MTRNLKIMNLVWVLLSSVYHVPFCFEGGGWGVPSASVQCWTLVWLAHSCEEACSPWSDGSWECRCRAGPEVVWQKLGLFKYRICSRKGETWSRKDLRRRESGTESQTWSPNTVLEGSLLWYTPGACESKCSLPHMIQNWNRKDCSVHNHLDKKSALCFFNLLNDYSQERLALQKSIKRGRHKKRDQCIFKIKMMICKVR